VVPLLIVLVLFLVLRIHWARLLQGRPLVHLMGRVLQLLRVLLLQLQLCWLLLPLPWL